jgi:hypothetical protein
VRPFGQLRNVPDGGLDGKLVAGTVLDGLTPGAEPNDVAPPEALDEPMLGVDGLMLGAEPKALAPPEALDEPMPGVVPTLLPKTLDGVPVMPGVVVTAPGVVVTAPGELTCAAAGSEESKTTNANGVSFRCSMTHSFARRTDVIAMQGLFRHEP